MAAERPEASATFGGLTATIRRSLGVDRALVVQLDGPEALADWNLSTTGDPVSAAIRVVLNETIIYNGRPYVDPEQE